jgi:hypothetical protein
MLNLKINKIFRVRLLSLSFRIKFDNILQMIGNT